MLPFIFLFLIQIGLILGGVPNPGLFPTYVPSYLTLANDNVIRIGTAQAYTTGDQTSRIPEGCVIATRLWEQKFNDRGGIVVNGKQYNVSVLIVDVGSSDVNQTVSRIVSAKIRTVWSKFCNASSEYGRIDFTIAPYSSTFTIDANVVAETCNMLCISGGASASNVYQCLETTPGNASSMPSDCAGKSNGDRRFAYSFGVRGVSENYLPAFLTVMKIKQARTVALINENNDFGLAVGNGVRDTVTRLNMELVYDAKIVNLQTNTNVTAAIEVYSPIIDQLVTINPDVVVVGGYTPGCIAFIEHSFAIRYAPKGYGATICIDQQGIDIDKAEYFASPSGWDVRLFGPGYDERRSNADCNLWEGDLNETTSVKFRNEYVNFPENLERVEPFDQVASTPVSFYVLHQAIFDMQSFDTTVLLDYINTLKIDNTVFGPVDFNPVGANVGKEFLTFQLVTVDVKDPNSNITLEIITPLSAATVDAIWPIPSWSERVYNDQYLKLDAEKGLVAVASFFIVCTFILMIAILILRNKPQIKAASFIFCEIILFGSLLVYISFYFWTVFTYTAFCNIQIWSFIMGYDILMGALLAKNLRLLYIFYHAMKLKRARPIENWHLLLCIGCLMAIDAVVIVIYQAAWPIVIFRIVVDPFKPALDYILCGTFYGSDYIQTAFIATLGALKAILLIVSMAIMVAIRKQPSEFNESKAIAFAIYNQSFCLIALLAIWLVIDDINYDLKYILRSIVVLWGCAITIFVIFGRKLYYIAIGKDKAFRSGKSKMASIKSETELRELTLTYFDEKTDLIYSFTN